jgi:serine/threonine-protein kinase
MGEVWRGVDVGFEGVERPVAIKLIAPGFAHEPELRRQFIAEAKLSFLLCHQNVVNVRDIGLAGGQYFIAMEWVDGADLGTIVRRLRVHANQPLPLRFACLVAVEAARGLDYAHRLCDAHKQPLHLVHRDVSPSNLLVSLEGEIKVSDFGIARSRMRQASMPGALKGKIGYMAPEQASGGPLDARADVFALGVVLYEMMAGQNPFRDPAGGEAKALERIRRGEIRPLRSFLPTVPQALEAIVMRAVAVDREARYGSCAQMREDLESFARRESYALSPSDFGQFVRDLLAAEVALPEREAPTANKRLSGSRAVAAPKSFNLALGGALASLDGEDAPAAPEGDAAPPETAGGGLDSPTPRWRKAVKLHTVALPQSQSPLPLHATIAPPSNASETAPSYAQSPTDLTSAIPRRRPIGWMIAAAMVVAAAGVVLAVVRQRAAPPPLVAATARPSVPEAPPPQNAPSPANPAPAPQNEPPPVKARERPHHRAPANASEAHLSITSDVDANAFIDGQFVQATPLVDYALAPGRHVVRVESTAPGLRLIPRVETVDIKAGELKQMNMELK